MLNPRSCSFLSPTTERLLRSTFIQASCSASQVFQDYSFANVLQNLSRKHFSTGPAAKPEKKTFKEHGIKTDKDFDIANFSQDKVDPDDPSDGDLAHFPRD